MERVSDHSKPLREQDLADDPLTQFAAWYHDAEQSGMRLPEAVALATATVDGAPSVRMVLLKAFDQRGFAFFSNYDSRKGRELSANPRAALMFHWDLLGRQVRIEGPVSRVDAAETAAYVHSRPRRSQLSALASPQSQTVPDRAALEQRVAQLEREHRDDELPVPENWGGFRLAPEVFEFWQQRDDRLHDRLVFRRGGGGAGAGAEAGQSASASQGAGAGESTDAGRWLVERLAP
jgi:pyridoxamine 5'-phosphate oxidase